MATVSYSEIMAYRRCPKIHDYAYVQRIQKRSRGAPLMRGTILHTMLDAVINKRLIKGYIGNGPCVVLEDYEDRYGEMFLSEVDEYGTIIDDCRTIFRNYITEYAKELLTYEETEIFVAADLSNDLRLIGYIDKIARDTEGRRWIMDHKFMKDIPGLDMRFTDIQLVVYCYLWNQQFPDRPINGIMWDYARTKVPTIPDMLKSCKGLSKNRTMSTTVATYRAAIKDCGFNEADYAEHLQFLEEKGAEFYERSPVPVPSKRLIDVVMEDFRITASTIQCMKGLPVRNKGRFTCMGCQYKEICDAELYDNDPAFVQKAYYEDRPETRIDYGNQNG